MFKQRYYVSVFVYACSIANIPALLSAMTYPEILKIDNLQTDPQELPVALNDVFSLQAIYCYHGTTEQADEVLAYIEPGSIVFCEGYFRTREYAEARLTQLHQLANGRLADNTFYSANQSLVDRTTEEFKVRQLAPNEAVDDFGYRLFEGIFAKNCVVLPADYINIAGAPETLTTPMSEEEWRNRLILLDPDTLDEFVDLEFEQWQKWLERQVLRETAAVRYIERYLGAIYHSGATRYLGNTRTGLTSVNIIYGLAHRVSLTNRLSRIGLQAQVTLVNSSLIPTDQLADFEQEMAIVGVEQRARIAAYYSELIQGRLELPGTES